MRFGDTKIILIDFYSYEIEALESYFEEMALKGWMLEKVSNLYIKFKKMEPKRIKYTIDVIDGVSEQGQVDEVLASEYREKLINLGWSYSCEFNKLQVFYKENEDKKSSISKKESEEIKCLFHNSLSLLILRIIVISVMLFTQFSSILRGRNMDYFTHNGNLLGLLFISIFIILCIIELFKLIKFRVSSNDEKRQSSLWIRFKGVILDIVFLSAGIGLITIILENNKEDFNIKVTIFALIIGILLLCYFIENKRDSFKKKLAISTYFVITIAVIILINNFIVSNIFNNRSNGIKNRENLLSLKDFNDEVSNEEDILVDENNSFLAHKLFYSANGKNMRLSYELFESDHKWMVNWNFNKMMKWFDNQGINYNEIKTNLPNEVKVYTNEKENNYIILSSNKIIEVIGLDEIDNKEGLLEVVYNKIFTNTKEEVI